VKKRQRRLGEVDEIVLSLYAKGLATGEISAHFAEIYGASVSKETISRIEATPVLLTRFMRLVPHFDRTLTRIAVVSGGGCSTSFETS